MRLDIPQEQPRRREGDGMAPGSPDRRPVTHELPDNPILHRLKSLEDRSADRRPPRPGAARKLSGKETALLVATACSDPPRGRKRWTLDLLADAMVKLTEHDSLSRETVRRRLAEDELKPWRKDMWCIAQVDAPMSPAWRTCSTCTPRTTNRSAR